MPKNKASNSKQLSTRQITLNRSPDMKHIPTLILAAIAAGTFITSCGPKAASGPAPSIIESQSLIGLWQKQREVTVEDESGVTLTALERTNLYKCILADGNFFLFRAETDSLTGLPTSRIEMYGTYALEGDTVCHETITNHCSLPELTGIESEVHYKLTDPKTLSLHYNLEVPDGSAGSSVWNPELWTRVKTN